MKISAIVITFNEEENIKDCLESVKWADEIIVVDSKSSDETIEIARSYTDKVFSVEMQNVTEKRKFSVDKAANDWILFVDADERISKELGEEILELKPPNDTAGYFLNRKNFYLGKWIKHCGIYPDYHIRLFNRKKAAVNDRIIHEGIEVKGKTLQLIGALLHYPVRNISGMVDKVNYYSTMESQEHFNNGRKISKAGAFAHAIATFLVMYFSRKGFMDKLAGFYISLSYSVTTFMTYLKLLKLQNKI